MWIKYNPNIDPYDQVPSEWNYFWAYGKLYCKAYPANEKYDSVMLYSPYEIGYDGKVEIRRGGNFSNIYVLEVDAICEIVKPKPPRGSSLL